MNCITPPFLRWVSDHLGRDNMNFGVFTVE